MYVFIKATLAVENILQFSKLFWNLFLYFMIATNLNDVKDN